MVYKYRSVDHENLSRLLRFLNTYTRPEAIRWNKEKHCCELVRVDAIQLRLVKRIQDSSKHTHFPVKYMVELDVLALIPTLNCRCAYAYVNDNQTQLSPVEGHGEMRLNAFELLPEVDEATVNSLLSQLQTTIPIPLSLLDELKGTFTFPTEIE